MANMPVQPDLLVWAREYRGLGLEEAAAMLSMSVEELRELEGGAPVNLTKFRKISDTYRIPRATLLRRTRPDVPPLPRDFRTIDGRPPHVGFETRLAIDYARTIAQNILELVEADAAPQTPILPVVQLDENPSMAGERERQRLGVPIGEQFDWQQNEAFTLWRALIERAGVYVLLQKFDLEDCKGFALYDDPNTPIIMISKAEEFEPARTFTLIHEYCHLLLRQPGISDQKMQNPVEAFCNRFAAAFLIPRDALQQLIQQWPDRPVEWDRDIVRVWARRLKVSQQALALRMEELAIAPPGFFRHIVAGQQQAARAPSRGGNYVTSQIYEMGNRYLMAVLSAIDGGGIRLGEAAEMTHLSPQHFDHVRALVGQRFERVGAVVGGIPH